MSDSGVDRSRSTPGVSVRKMALSAFSAPATAEAAVSALMLSQPLAFAVECERWDDRERAEVREVGVAEYISSEEVRDRTQYPSDVTKVDRLVIRSRRGRSNSPPTDNGRRYHR